MEHKQKHPLGDKPVGWIGRVGSGKQSHYIALKAGVYCLSAAEHGGGQGPPPKGRGAWVSCPQRSSMAHPPN